MGNASFAAQNRHLKNGGRYFPRWFKETPFWQKLGAAHREILRQLYDSVAHSDTVHQASGITVRRGEWLTSYKALADNSGATFSQARCALKHAERAGVISIRKRSYRVGPHTQHLSHITWYDFDAYEWPDRGRAQNTRHNTTHDTRHDTRQNTAQQKEPPVITPIEEHSGETSGSNAQQQPAAAVGDFDSPRQTSRIPAEHLLKAFGEYGLETAARQYLAEKLPHVTADAIHEAMKDVSDRAGIGARVDHFRQNIAQAIELVEQRREEAATLEAERRRVLARIEELNGQAQRACDSNPELAQPPNNPDLFKKALHELAPADKAVLASYWPWNDQHRKDEVITPAIRNSLFARTKASIVWGRRGEAERWFDSLTDEEINNYLDRFVDEQCGGQLPERFRQNLRGKIVRTIIIDHFAPALAGAKRSAPECVAASTEG
ncbi:hypothetical protein ACERK3_01505 [Phycisphaerales bacterium AB-hyl4]|uniref:Uncharacterized protein n=1 Tax=Natronomicrosphaera hydrolytica TaxID=3242702 RepID=A0ABV4U040_9BACT